MIRGLCLGNLCPCVIARIQTSSGFFLVCWSAGGWCNKWIQGWSNRCSLGRRGKRERFLQGNELEFLLTLVWRVEAKLLSMASQAKVEMSAWHLTFWE